MSLANKSKPDRKAVIVLTCCALQSACYSPTGIVISFILAQFQGEVQTNLTAGTRKKCAFHRARRFRMPAAIGLRHPASASCLGRHLRLAGRCPNNSSLLPPLAAVVVVALWAFSAENHLIFRVSGKSADFPETHFHRRGRRGKRQSQRRFLRKRGVAGKCCWSAPSQSKPNGFARFPLLSLRDIFPRSGGSLSSKGEPRALPETFSLRLIL